MRQFFKRLFCQHNFRWVRNIYGDQIILHNWKRSMWKCVDCGKLQARDHLEPEKLP